MKKLSFMLAIVALFALYSNAACPACKAAGANVQGSGMMCGKQGMACGCGGPMPTIMSLNLTDKQREQANAIMAQWHKDKMELMKDNGIPMNKAFANNKFDRDVFLKEHAKMDENMANKKADVVEKLYSILTPEQKQELAQKASQIK